MKTVILSLFFFFIVSSANAKDPAFCNNMYLMVKVYYEGVNSTAFEDQYDILSSRAYEDPYFGVTANCLQVLQSSGKGNYIHVFVRNFNVFVYIKNQYDGHVAYDSLDEFYNSIPIDKNDKNGLYLDYIEHYKNDTPQKAVAITRNSITKEINWDDYEWGIAYDENTIKEARESAMEYCNETDKKANDECIILIENNKVVLNITKTSGYCFNGLEKMVGLKPPKRIENILREDCAVHSF